MSVGELKGAIEQAVVDLDAVMAKLATARDDLESVRDDVYGVFQQTSRLEVIAASNSIGGHVIQLDEMIGAISGHRNALNEYAGRL